MRHALLLSLLALAAAGGGEPLLPPQRRSDDDDDPDEGVDPFGKRTRLCEPVAPPTGRVLLVEPAPRPEPPIECLEEGD